MKTLLVSLLIFATSLLGYSQNLYKTDADISVGAKQTDNYLKPLDGLKVAVVGNHTSMVDSVHVVDFLLNNGVEVVKVFAPEHGFRGKADAGEKVDSEIDSKTGLPIVSLYGSHKKPTAEDLSGVDLVIFDIQDVGARFYTYISTMTYVMEACAENEKKNDGFRSTESKWILRGWTNART